MSRFVSETAAGKRAFLGAFDIFNAIFCLLWFILKQICLFWLFQNTSEAPKQTETKFSLVSKITGNFLLEPKLFVVVLRSPYLWAYFNS